jgi:hypothetical protein
VAHRSGRLKASTPEGREEGGKNQNTKIVNRQKKLKRADDDTEGKGMVKIYNVESLDGAYLLPPSLNIGILRFL